jgi:HEAT repeat protein
VLKDATLFRLTGSQEAGERLIEALGSSSEDARLVAGMGLVAGGENAVPLVAEALSADEHLWMLMDIAESLVESGFGVDEIKAALEPLRNHEDASIASDAERIIQSY